MAFAALVIRGRCCAALLDSGFKILKTERGTSRHSRAFTLPAQLKPDVKNIQMEQRKGLLRHLMLEFIARDARDVAPVPTQGEPPVFNGRITSLRDPDQDLRVKDRRTIH